MQRRKGKRACLAAISRNCFYCSLCLTPGPAARTLFISEVIRYEGRVIASLDRCDLALDVVDEELIPVSLCNLQDLVEALKFSFRFGCLVLNRHWAVSTATDVVAIWQVYPKTGDKPEGANREEWMLQNFLGYGGLPASSSLISLQIFIHASNPKFTPLAPSMNS